MFTRIRCVKALFYFYTKTSKTHNIVTACYNKTFTFADIIFYCLQDTSSSTAALIWLIYQYCLADTANISGLHEIIVVYMAVLSENYKKEKLWEVSHKKFKTIKTFKIMETLMYIVYNLKYIAHIKSNSFGMTFFLFCFCFSQKIHEWRVIVSFYSYTYRYVLFIFIINNMIHEIDYLCNLLPACHNFLYNSKNNM